LPSARTSAPAPRSREVPSGTSCNHVRRRARRARSGRRRWSRLRARASSCRVDS